MTKDVLSQYSDRLEKKAIFNAVARMRKHHELVIIGGNKTDGYHYKLVRGDNDERLLPNDEESRQATQD
jgi:hypothetical protein